MNRISACLITLNEEHNLARALASLTGIADEIVVVDCGSQDRTLEIAEEHRAKTEECCRSGGQQPVDSLAGCR